MLLDFTSYHEAKKKFVVFNLSGENPFFKFRTEFIRDNNDLWPKLNVMYLNEFLRSLQIFSQSLLNI